VEAIHASATSTTTGLIPNPLPDELELASATVDAVADAALALGRLDQAGLQIPNARLLRRPTLRREAQSTSALEGTYAALTEVLEADLDVAAPKTPQIREILNYVAAAEHAYSWVTTDGRQITSGLLCETHALLMSGIDTGQTEPGTVRDIQVVIGAGGRVNDARFVPPPPGHHLETGLSDLFDWMHRPHRRPARAVVDSALAHYQFETLHPFHDGNGRIGRLLIVLQLLSSGVLTEPLFTVSPWFEARRSVYQDELLNVSATGDFDRWIRFFCEGVRAQAEASASKITDLLAFQQHATNTARGAGRHNLSVDIASDLIERPILTVTATKARYGVSFPAANNAIAKLVGLGLLSEITGRTQDRVFRADEVLRILER
jgi:cell filamentation protein, protein adenylyltransferase